MIDLNDPRQTDWFTLNGMDADQPNLPGGDPSPPTAPPSAPPAAGGPAVTSTSTAGTRAWHNTTSGQLKINNFKATYKAYFKRDPTPDELWQHFLQYDREPSDQFMSDILGNLRNVSQQQGQQASAGSTAPSGRAEGQSFRDYFQSLTQGKEVTQQTLLDLESALQAAGSKLTPANAGGERTKIWDPDTQDWVRVGFGEGAWQWIPQGWGENGPQGAGEEVAPMLAPWTTPFEYPSYEPPPAFQAPTGEEAFNDQGFQFALGQGRQALERSAAAKGTLLTTGALKDLDQFSQGAASQQYDKVYGRRLGEYQQQGGLERQDYARDYDKALGEYRQAYDIFNNNQDRPFNKLAAVAGFGQTAGNSLLGAGQGYAGMYGNTLGNMGNQMGNYWTQGANAAAAGQVGSANAWNNAFGQIGQQMAPYLYQNLWRGQSSSYPTGFDASQYYG